jgi:DNA-binding MarR family transcriptional regulator
VVEPTVSAPDAASEAPKAPPRQDAVEAVRSLARVFRVLERTSDELNLAHYRVLSAVAAGDERASRVAARLALGRPTVSAAVDALSRRGLLDRETASADHRVSVLHLTPLGREVLERTEAAMAGTLTALLAGTEGEDGVYEALARVGTAIDAAMERHAAARGRKGKQ